MILKLSLAALALAGSSIAAAQMPAPVLSTAMSGTRLDIAATGEVTRVPDIAVINTGVVTRAATAGEAIRSNAQAMERIIARLRRAGVAERDIQTSAINLNPDYRYEDDKPPVLTGYRAVNQVTVRFRDIADSGAILDALVAEGANQISGPSLTIDKPEEAMDEARLAALKTAEARAAIYARAMGKRVKRIIAVSESGSEPPRPYEIVVTGGRSAMAADTKIAPGEQNISATLSVSFELE